MDSRITLHLTVTSAALVVLALVTQASGFGTPFFVFSIGLTTTILVLGTLTGIRVHNASIDDTVMIAGTLGALVAAAVGGRSENCRLLLASRRRQTHSRPNSAVLTNP